MANRNKTNTRQTENYNLDYIESHELENNRIVERHQKKNKFTRNFI